MTPPTEGMGWISDPGHTLQIDPLDVCSDEVARIVIKDRPEVAACLDGLVFRGQEDAMIPLLRAALVNMMASVLLDLEDEDAISACVADLTVQTARMQLAGKALNWEVQTRRDLRAGSGHRSAGYRAEIDELLHGPLPPLELLDRQEQDVVVRRVKESLGRESQVGDADAEVRIGELRAILEDTDIETAGFPLFITKLSRSCLAEWFAKWSEEAFRETQEVRSVSLTPTDSCSEHEVDAELTFLRDIQMRLRPPGRGSKGLDAEECRPIPRSAS